jgi:hypothetical protein
VIYIRKLLLPILLFALPKMAIAQATQPVDDSQAPYLVAFLSGNDSAVDKWVERAVSYPTDGVLREISSACRVRIIDAKKPSSVYDTRYRNAISEDRLPAIVFTQSDGGVLYVADRTALPPNESALAREIQYFAEAAENAIRLDSPNWPNSNRGEMQYIQQDCPDGVCPVPTTPNSGDTVEQRRPLFPRLQNTREPKNIMDNWFSTNYEGISPVTMVVVLVLFVLVFFMRGANNGDR